MPGEPIPTPTGLASTAVVDQLKQKSQLSGLRAALQGQHIDPETIDTVVQQQAQAQAQIVNFGGRIENILQSADPLVPGNPPNFWYVRCKSTAPPDPDQLQQTPDRLNFQFPPNDPKYLPELMRAQTNNLTVGILYAPGADNNLLVGLSIWAPGIG
jgi:hypothetical protein